MGKLMGFSWSLSTLFQGEESWWAWKEYNRFVEGIYFCGTLETMLGFVWAWMVSVCNGTEILATGRGFQREFRINDS